MRNEAKRRGMSHPPAATSGLPNQNLNTTLDYVQLKACDYDAKHRGCKARTSRSTQKKFGLGMTAVPIDSHRWVNRDHLAAPRIFPQQRLGNRGPGMERVAFKRGPRRSCFSAVPVDTGHESVRGAMWDVRLGPGTRLLSELTSVRDVRSRADCLLFSQKEIPHIRSIFCLNPIRKPERTLP